MLKKIKVLHVKISEIDCEILILNNILFIYELTKRKENIL